MDQHALGRLGHHIVSRRVALGYRTRIDFAIRQEWWTGDSLPEAKVVRREMTGVPTVEVIGRSKEKVEEIFWDTISQARAEVAGVPRK